MGSKAIVLFGHGSRDPLWRLPIEGVAARVAQERPDLLVRCAYLELEPPDLPTAVAGLAQAGATDIALLPMFLGMGRHAREDLPKLVEALRQQYPRIRFDLRPPVGEHPDLVSTLVRIAAD
ncbi:CbiX/SirB N-terminal domain-containing protein [Ramlibacter sp.]|uniref:sirohydrochlorin chelatase n=1 Tax=Ramlibacter sp. TaxID=1917967 RepID=UPI0017C2F874|nr:CbiX/SirB N-terminal domain-containing protein [Ramlibacter sp.]MBA2673974.1 CbiX/SirB N-terminal domain-containing protein [Ramlibacter sp.]